jgi:hypothetical protein
MRPRPSIISDDTARLRISIFHTWSAAASIDELDAGGIQP